jgi:hypothetical protein
MKTKNVILFPTPVYNRIISVLRSIGTTDRTERKKKDQDLMGIREFGFSALTQGLCRNLPCEGGRLAWPDPI